MGFRIDPVFGTRIPLSSNIPEHPVSSTFLVSSSLRIVLRKRSSDRSPEEDEEVERYRNRTHFIETGGMPEYQWVGPFKIHTPLGIALHKRSEDRDEDEDRLVAEYRARNGGLF